MFLADTVKGIAIREEAVYDGIRITLQGKLGVARLPLQVDVGFGDAVTPTPTEAAYPALLADMPAPRLRVYARETAIAEKVEAMVQLGLANSRMKDFFDVWFLAQAFEFDEATLATAIRATFERRRTPMPTELPVGLTSAFAADSSKAAQWRAFVARWRFPGTPPSLPAVIALVAGFIEPVLVDVRAPTARGEKYWRPGVGWQQS